MYFKYIMKLIYVDDVTHRRLNIVKAKKEYRSLDEVIKYLLKEHPDKCTK